MNSYFHAITEDTSENLIYKDEYDNILFYRRLTDDELETLIAVLMIIKTDRGI